MRANCASLLLALLGKRHSFNTSWWLVLAVACWLKHEVVLQGEARKRVQKQVRLAMALQLLDDWHDLQSAEVTKEVSRSHNLISCNS